MQLKNGHVTQGKASDPSLASLEPPLISSVQAQVVSLPPHYACTRPQHKTETPGPMGVWTLVQRIIW